MKTDWDYTDLAKAYVKRAEYAPHAIDAMLRVAAVKTGDRVCDVGAGAAHLAHPLAERGLRVDAVEPNLAMRNEGMTRTRGLETVTWHEGVGEATGRASGSYTMVTFGSSFNVVDRPKALEETRRLLVRGGWFACMWNHRDLTDPLQARIEGAIRARVPSYGLGVRREDQTALIRESGLFDAVVRLEGDLTHRQSRADCLEAWRSHGTLSRQAGAAFDAVLRDIDTILAAMPEPLHVPYTTRIWMASARQG